MRLKAGNTTGTLQVEYKITVKRYKDSEFVELLLMIRLPGKEEFTFFDNVLGLEGDTYRDNLQIAYIKAEKKWEIDLLSLTTTNTVLQ